MRSMTRSNPCAGTEVKICGPRCTVLFLQQPELWQMSRVFLCAAYGLF